jgi:hypothetical protein
LDKQVNRAEMATSLYKARIEDAQTNLISSVDANKGETES